MTRKEIQERAEAIDHLRELLDEADNNTVYTIYRHVSRSGMLRVISPVIIRDGEPVNIAYWVSKATGLKLDTMHRDGIKMHGAGMDMGFALVYDISRTLWPNGYACTGERCMSGDHVNGPNPDRDYTPGHTIHKDGGYRLIQRSL